MIFTLEQWTAMLDNKNTKAVEVLYKDFSKAFDSLQPSKLMLALNSLGLSTNMQQLCLNFLCDRQQRVRVKSTVSSYIPVKVGVPQGTLAGPMFWLAFINSYNPPTCSTVTVYADDVTCSSPISSSNDSQLRCTIDWGLEWCSEHSMTLNLNKTKAMILRRKPNSIPPVIESPVEIVSSWKFLGVFIDQNLNFHDHINYVTAKAHKRFYCLLQLKRVGVSHDKLCLFYTANIRSVLTYCIPAFYSLLTATQINSLERVQRLCTKIILPATISYSERLAILCIPMLSVFSENLYRSHFFKIVVNQQHPLHKFIPERQSSNRRHSSRLSDTFIVSCRTQKRRNSFFNFAVTNFL